MANTREDILRMAKDNDVKFVRLQFVDILGTVKNVAITVEQLSKALDGEMMFDGSSIEGFVRIEESDMYLKPDLDTWVVYPWRPREGSVARLICDIYTPDGKPFMGDPRNVLKKIIAEAAEMGYSMNVGPECEFFLFQKDANGNPTTITHDQGGYFDLAPIDNGENARRDMVLNLEKMNFEIEASHHEVAEGQHEIDFKYNDALSTADNVVTFKTVVRTVANLHGLHATFMPKPVFGINGSGMHCNVSLFKDGQNAFFDPNAEYQLSEVAMQFMAGVLSNARAIAALTNPIVNSYKRLVPGYEAPVYIAWSPQNRSPLVRVPAKRGISTRIEFRNPDPSCNPYLVFAAILAAGLKGIKEKMTPPAPVFSNLYEMTKAEMDELGIKSLPGSLEEAVEEMKQCGLLKEALGDHLFTKYIEAKEAEWDDYRTKVSQWEIDNYLRKF